MISRKILDKLSASLESGFFADEIIKILTKYKKNKSISSPDKVYLKKAKDFLEEAMRGHNWLEENSYENQKSAFAFSQALKIYDSIEPSENFINYIKKLKQLLNKIYTEQNMTKKEIDGLLNFFTAYSKKQLEASEEFIRGNEYYSKWQLTKAF
jgi:hypothetical protein